jgi:hypothetical protein
MAKSSKKAAEAVEETQAQVPAQAETETTQEPVQLTIADLQLLARIVDLASRRGAFQAAELSQVGESFNKLSSFLTYVEGVQKKEAEAAGETAAETEAVAETEAEAAEATAE